MTSNGLVMNRILILTDTIDKTKLIIIMSTGKLKTFIEKAKIWVKDLGFTNVVYFLLALGTLTLGHIPLKLVGLVFLKPYLVGAFTGIFCYINWNKIAKLYKDKIGNPIDDKFDEIVDNAKEEVEEKVEEVKAKIKKKKASKK